jgi:hypothetical protein
MANTIKFLGRRLGMSGSPGVKRYAITVTGSYVQGAAVGVAGETLNFNAASNLGYRSRPRIPNGGASKYRKIKISCSALTRQ